MQLHAFGDERTWWDLQGIDPLSWAKNNFKKFKGSVNVKNYYKLSSHSFFKKDVNITANITYPAKYDKNPDYLSGKNKVVGSAKRGRPKKASK